MSGLVRAFLALPLTAEGRDEVDRALDPLRRLGEPVRWVPAENLHVTLRFFGDIDPGLRARLEECLAAAAARVPPFPWSLGGPGAFPNLRSARVLWVGASEGESSVTALAAAVEESLGGLGFESEKRFHAHITVGRTKGRLSPKFQDRFAALGGLTCRAEARSFHLMKSTLTPKGALYDSLREFPLGA